MSKAASAPVPKELLEQIYREVQARVEASLKPQIAELEHKLAVVTRKAATLARERDEWRTRFFQEQQRARDLQGQLDLAQIKIRELEQLAEKQRAQIESLQQQLHGRKSERGKPAPDEPVQPKRGRGRQSGTKGHGRKPRNNIEPEDCFHDFSAADRECPRCGLPYEHFGEKVSEEIHVEYKLIRRVHRRKTIIKTCKCPGVPRIKTAPAPPKLFKGSLLSTETWSHVIFDKYHLQRPLNRVRQALCALGLEISQGTLTNGLKRLYENRVFKPLVEDIRRQVSASKQQQKDETGWKVFQEIDGKKGFSWYLWVTLGGDCTLFELDPSRSRKVAKRTVSDAPVVIVTDFLSTYHNMGDNVTNAWCWAHLRRWLLELARVEGQAKLANSWVKRVNNIFHLNKLRLATRDDAQFNERDHELKYALAEFERHVKRNAARSGMHPDASKVFQTIAEHWEGLTVFARMPGVPMDNNASERALRNAVTGRKSYYGSGSHWSGLLAADLFTIFTTLEQNGVNPRLWLTEYLTAVARNGGRAPANATSFLPWNTPPVECLES